MLKLLEDNTGYFLYVDERFTELHSNLKTI